MQLRVLLGAVVAGLILIGSGGLGARADLGSAAGDVQTFEATEISASNAVQPAGAPAANGEHSSADDADPDSDQDPVVKVRQSGFLLDVDPRRRPAARQTAQCLPGRPPAPPPRSGEAAKTFAAQSASVGAETHGSEFLPPYLVAVRGAQSFLSNHSRSLSAARAQAFAGHDRLTAVSDSVAPCCLSSTLGGTPISFTASRDCTRTSNGG